MQEINILMTISESPIESCFAQNLFRTKRMTIGKELPTIVGLLAILYGLHLITSVNQASDGEVIDKRKISIRGRWPIVAILISADGNDLNHTIVMCSGKKTTVFPFL